MLFLLNTWTIPVEQKQPYDKYDIAENTGTIPVDQKQPYDKYDIAHNTGTIPAEQKQPYDKYSRGMVPVFCAISYLS
jgi:acetyl-CoA carboxylase carboxyltransferase component